MRICFVQFGLGIRGCKDTSEWRIMQRYECMKKNKGRGKSIVAAARKMSEIVWAMLSDKQDFNAKRMIRKYQSMTLAEEVLTDMN